MSSDNPHQAMTLIWRSPEVDIHPPDYHIENSITVLSLDPEWSQLLYYYSYYKTKTHRIPRIISFWLQLNEKKFIFGSITKKSNDFHKTRYHILPSRSVPTF